MKRLMDISGFENASGPLYTRSKSSIPILLFFERRLSSSIKPFPSSCSHDKACPTSRVSEPTKVITIRIPHTSRMLPASLRKAQVISRDLLLSLLYRTKVGGQAKAIQHRHCPSHLNKSPTLVSDPRDTEVSYEDHFFAGLGLFVGFDKSSTNSRWSIYRKEKVFSLDKDAFPSNILSLPESLIFRNMRFIALHPVGAAKALFLSHSDQVASAGPFAK